MKITLVTLGKTEEDYIKEGIKKYIKRLNHYIQFEIKEIPASKSTFPKEVLKQKESVEITKITEKSKGLVFLLDEQGKEYSSIAFASFLQKQMSSGGRNLYFIIGGAYGFHESIYKISAGTISLSRMTFTHQMVRLVFAEQMYRAMTILKGEKYHH